MKIGKIKISDLLIYRWRYWIGYGLVAIGLIVALVFAGMYLPGGISNQEIQSVIKSSSINFADLWSINIINLPYHLLQNASLALFGVSILSIKLPSIILAFLSVVGIVLLLGKWFKPSIAVLASLIAITTGQFLFIAQDGTPTVLYLFWPILLILIASIIARKPTKFRLFFKVAFCITAALSLYTPLSIYIIVALVSVILIHPHLRFLIKQLSKPKIIITLIVSLILLIVSLILLIPLGISIIKTPSVGLTLLGIPTRWPDFMANISSLGVQYFGFSGPSGATIITPFFELGSVLLIALGVYFVFKTKETAKSYAIILWTLLLIPVVILNPNLTNITFLPLVLLLASGLNGLLAHWYKLFPSNPYARIGGLVPVVILVIVLVLSGVNRFVYGYKYDPNIVPSFSKDLRLIPADTKNIVVSSSELDFYKLLEKHNKQLNISTKPIGNTFLATHDAKQTFSRYKIDRIITSPNSNQSDRFYVYKKL